MTPGEAFRDQAGHCAALGSPFMARLMTLVADRLAPGTAVADRVLGWPGDPAVRADSLPLRFAGALHALKIEGLALGDVYPPAEVDDDRLWAAVEAAMRDHEAALLRRLDSAPQTNEVRRAAVILPALALIAARHRRPVALFELGASGGLNLRADRFRVEGGGWSLGPEGAAVRIGTEWRGAPPPDALPEVVHRAGVDLNPLDPATPEGRLSLLAYLWPDQPERLARTEAAIDEARRTPADLAAGDAADWLGPALERSMPGVMRVVYHTVAWQYFPPGTQRRAEATLEAAGARATQDAPLVRLGMENDGSNKGARLTLTTWPGGTEGLGRADFHGRWVDWRVAGAF